MSPLTKALRGVLRWLAVGLLIIVGLLLGLEVVESRTNGTNLNAVKVTLHLCLFTVGVVILIASQQFAAWITGDADEGDDAHHPPPDTDADE